MDIEHEEYFRDMFELFRCKGWDRLMNELKDDMILLQTVKGIDNLEQLFYAKGKDHILGDLLTIGDRTLTRYEEMQAEAKEETEKPTSNEEDDILQEYFT